VLGASGVASVRRATPCLNDTKPRALHQQTQSHNARYIAKTITVSVLSKEYYFTSDSLIRIQRFQV